MKTSFDAIFFGDDGVVVDPEPLFPKAIEPVLPTAGVDLTASESFSRSLARLDSMTEWPRWIGLP